MLAHKLADPWCRLDVHQTIYVLQVINAIWAKGTCMPSPSPCCRLPSEVHRGGFLGCICEDLWHISGLCIPAHKHQLVLLAGHFLEAEEETSLAVPAHLASLQGALLLLGMLTIANIAQL